jgi:hypothetical protein
VRHSSVGCRGLPFDAAMDSDKQEIQQVERINILKIVRLSTKLKKYYLNNRYYLIFE